MTTAYTPYSQTRPKTTNLHELRTELAHVREHHGRRSSQALEAFNALCAAHHTLGIPIDGLRRHTANEVERFFAFTVAGADGHVYWDGARHFRRNDNSKRTPARWWWEHLRRPLRHGDGLLNTCGQANCINPEHATIQDRRERHLIFTDEQMLGALQVAAMRLGHTPTQREWLALAQSPSYRSYQNRFGSWDNAIRAAGLQPNRVGPRSVTADECVAAIHLARKILNRWPFITDLDKPAMREALRAAGLPTSDNTIRKHLGSAWADVLKRAGKP